MTAADSNVRPVDHAREARYAEAIGKACLRPDEPFDGFGYVARAVIAVADAEQEELRGLLEDPENDSRTRRLYLDNIDLRQDRDEWKQSTIAANRRFEAAEAHVAELEAALERSRYDHQGAVEQLAKMRKTALREAEFVIADAWEDGNCTGLDGWIGEDRGEQPDEHAIAEKRRHIETALDRLAAALAPATSPAEQEADRG